MGGVKLDSVLCLWNKPCRSSPRACVKNWYQELLGDKQKHVFVTKAASWLTMIVILLNICGFTHTVCWYFISCGFLYMFDYLFVFNSDWLCGFAPSITAQTVLIIKPLEQGNLTGAAHDQTKAMFLSVSFHFTPVSHWEKRSGCSKEMDERCV